jgi:hypothetical protein
MGGSAPGTVATMIAGVPPTDRVRWKTQRDLEASLGFLIAGTALLAVWAGLWASGAGGAAWASPGARFFLLYALGEIGAVLFVVGAVFAAVNSWLLRHMRTNPAE